MSDAFKIDNLFHSDPLRLKPSVRSRLGNLFRRVIVGDSPLVRLSDEAHRQKQRRVALSVGAILLVLLLVSVGLGARRRQHLKREVALERLDERVTYLTGQAGKLAGMQPARAREMLVTEKAKLERELAVTTDKAVAARIASLLEELDRSLETAGRVIRANPEEFLDIGLIREDTRGSSMAGSGEQLLILDSAAGVLLLVSAVNRSGEVVGGGIESALGVAGSSKQAYILMNNRILETIYAGKTSTPVVEDQEQSWEDPIAIAFFSGSLYLLDRGASDIYKYPPTGSGYGARNRWLAPGFTPDLTDAQDMDIDGDVWVLHASGRIAKYRHGASAGFRLEGVGDLKAPKRLSVPVVGERVWILEPAAQRVVAVDRETGAYAGQWVAEMIGKTDDLVVSEELGKIFLLAGEKIYVIEM